MVFIPEQLEDTSLNVLPRELSVSHLLEIRDGDGEGLGLGQCSTVPSGAHTHTPQHIPENPWAVRDPPSAVHQKPE